VIFDQFVEFGLFEGLVLEFFLFLFLKKSYFNIFMFDLFGFGADIFERSEFAFDVEDSFDGFLLFVFHVGYFGLDGL
jgi:hypothetical protein